MDKAWAEGAHQVLLVTLVLLLLLKNDIREPLGTHGYMKCAFDGVINQQDTVRALRGVTAVDKMMSTMIDVVFVLCRLTPGVKVCMSLYKRVFPKWHGE